MELSNAAKGIVLFDGVCNLCNNSIQWIIKHDKKDKFRFAALDSDLGKALIQKYNIQIDGIVLVSSDKAYTKSSAALIIAKSLSGIIPLLYLGMLIPKFVRDFFYDIIARNRYKWFGKRDECWLPTPELKRKFIA